MSFLTLAADIAGRDELRSDKVSEGSQSHMRSSYDAGSEAIAMNDQPTGTAGICLTDRVTKC